MRNNSNERNTRLERLISIERDSKTLDQIGDELSVSREAVRQWQNGESVPRDEVFLNVLEKSKVTWARELARKCLHLRYPQVFPNGTTKD